MAEKAGIIVMVIMAVITAVMVTTLLAAEGGEESVVEAAGEGFVCIEGLPLSPELQEVGERQDRTHAEEKVIQKHSEMVEITQAAGHLKTPLA